jgi:hypothetical protein
MARKLLVATLGLCTVSYVACGGRSEHPPGNLMAPPGEPTVEPTTDPTATPTTDPTAAPTNTVPEDEPDPHPTGNLMPPPSPPPDKSKK